MKKIITITAAFLLVATFSMYAQTYKTRDAAVHFNPNKDQSKKDYAAASKQGTAVFNSDNGEVALLLPIKTFRFNNALLEEHFNENYLHSNKYPNATYKGKLTGFTKDMLAKNGTYSVTSTGSITLHGVTKSFTGKATLVVSGKTATFNCDLGIKAEDFKIEIPDLVKSKLVATTPVSATIKFQM